MSVSMTPEPGQPSLERSLAFKAYEIEELADVYFFRPLGALIAHASRSVGISPDALTVFGGIVGVVAGSLLYDPALGLFAFGLLIVHGIIDSADGQLARLTNRTSEFGRILDGAGGYATHAAVYLAIALGAASRGTSPAIFAWAGAAAVCNTMQAQMYDYHRTVYATVVVRGRAPAVESPAQGWAGWLARRYAAVQRRLIGDHAAAEQALRDRAASGTVSAADRQRYRAAFYWPVRGWNLLGDNTRFYAIGVLAWLHRLEWFFAFILIPMNAALIMMWLWQARADRRFLGSL